MRQNNDTRKKKFLALFLSLMMVSSTAAFSACGTDDDTSSSDSSSSEEITKADTNPIKNGDFEQGIDEDALIGTTVSSWTRSVNSPSSGSALSSKSASGTINVTKDAWKNLTGTGLTDLDPATMTEEEAENYWDDMTAADKLKYYDAWEDANDDDDKDVEDLDFYESFNIDSEDLPTCDNPLTWNYDHEEDGVIYNSANEKVGSNVLMLHNEYYNSTLKNKGTAQKYTSSTTITVQAGTSVQFSVWVKTSDLKSPTDADSEEELPAVGKGAYISITHSVGSKSLDPLLIKNIDTSDTPVNAENNWGWEKYEFLLQGSSFTDTTFTIVLGLGQGGGTDTFEYVNGYAFFDDITCKTISNGDYEEALKAAGLSNKEFTVASTQAQKTIDAYTNADKQFALDFYGNFQDDTSVLGNISGEYTTQKNATGTYTSIKNPTDGSSTYTGLGFDTTGDIKESYDSPASMRDANASNKLLQSIYADYFKDNNLFTNVLSAENQKVLMLLSTDGAAMTAKSDKTYTVKAGEYLAISFFLKTSDMYGVTGAGVTLKETKGSNKVSFESLDVSDITTVDIDEETTDIYGGWQQCFFFVENSTNDDLSFTLSFNLGPTSIIGTTKSSYEAGFAAFTGFMTKEMDKEDFNCVTSGTYAKTVSLVGDETTVSGDSGFDTVASLSADAIEKGFADPKNYKGVYSNSEYLGGSGDAEINTNVNAGLLNKEYVKIENDDGEKVENIAYTEILNKLGGSTWEEVFGDSTYNAVSTQPLVIYNEGVQTKSYGFIGSSTSLSANSYTSLSMRVKVSAGAKAYIYLVSTDEDSYGEKFTVSRNRTYWYDKNGNVCVEDPSENEKSSNIAFYKQSNGLYKVNTAWSGSTGIPEDRYFANLAAYERVSDGETTYLKLASDFVAYDYSDGRNDGNDGIAFYNYDATKDAAYAYSSNQTEANLVYDFSTVANIARYSEKTSDALYFEVSDTKGEWQIVTFHLHLGDNAKNYRLEVWNGNREGTVMNPAGSYVIFDSWAPDSLTSTTFPEEVKSVLKAQGIDEEAELDNYFKGVYSFYDSDRFLRYDESLDENEVNDSFESYLSSSYTASVSYLKYAEGNEQAIFADYANVEITVAEDVETTDDDDDDDDDGDDDNDTNPWLLGSSIAIAAVLVLAVVSLVVRKIWARVKRNRGVKVLNNRKKD